MLELKRVLAPVDFSDSTARVLDYAIGIAEKFAAELVVLHVVPELVLTLPDVMMPTPLPTPPMDDLIQAARGELLKLDQAQHLERLPHRLLVSVGDPYPEIVRVGEQEKADLLVLGTHGRTGLAHLLIGSTAEKVVRKSPCPVLTVRRSG